MLREIMLGLWDIVYDLVTIPASMVSNIPRVFVEDATNMLSSAKKDQSYWDAEYYIRELAGELTDEEVAELKRQERENYENNIRSAYAWADPLYDANGELYWTDQDGNRRYDW